MVDRSFITTRRSIYIKDEPDYWIQMQNTLLGQVKIEIAEDFKLNDFILTPEEAMQLADLIRDTAHDAKSNIDAESVEFANSWVLVRRKGLNKLDAARS
jgi:hypothetical protein